MTTERCACGATTDIETTISGGLVRLEIGQWPWNELPNTCRWIVVDGIAHRAIGGYAGDITARLAHDSACPLRVRTQPHAEIPARLWARHKLPPVRAVWGSNDPLNANPRKEDS